MSEWRRLSERAGFLDPDEALHDGIPGWLRQSLGQWVKASLAVSDGTRIHPSPERLRALERRCRLELDWQYDQFSAERSLISLMDTNPRLFLDAVDILVTDYADGGTAGELEQALADGGSLWRVVAREGQFRLERRVEEGVADAAEQAMEAGRSGQLLARAWTHMYGRDPNASAAYREAVRAVEAAAQPVVLPSDAKATLGKIIAAMKDAPSKWHVVLEPGGGDAVGHIVGMLELLWKSQHDRHGDPDETRPLGVSDAEAEAGVHLAATLVHLFARDAVSRV